MSIKRRDLNPYPEKWLGYVAPLKRPRRVLVRHTTASATCAVEDNNHEEETPSLPPDHDYAGSPTPLLDQPLKHDKATQCSGPPELNKQLLRSDHLSLLYTGLNLETFSFLADQLTKDYINAFQMDALTSQQDYIIVARHHGGEDEDLHPMAAQGDHSSYNATMF
ncbi:unnamed protein product [Leuciscus chuanchicus]